MTGPNFLTRTKPKHISIHIYRVYGLSPLLRSLHKNPLKCQKRDPVWVTLTSTGKKVYFDSPKNKTKNKIATPSSPSTYKITAVSWWPRIVDLFINIFKKIVESGLSSRHVPLFLCRCWRMRIWCSSPRPAPLWVQEARGCPSNEPIAAALRVPVARRSTNWRARSVAVRWGAEGSQPPTHQPPSTPRWQTWRVAESVEGKTTRQRCKRCGRWCWMF